MIPSEFIKSELKKFILEFPKTRVRYENHIDSNTHSIEVVPNEIYHLNEDYIKWENTFFDVFTELFRDQNICFISDDAIVGLDEIHFMLFGKEYISIIPSNNIYYNHLLTPNSISNNNVILNFNNLSSYSGINKISNNIVSSISCLNNNNISNSNISLGQSFYNNNEISPEKDYQLAA
jgi:hypothetical protein